MFLFVPLLYSDINISKCASPITSFPDPPAEGAKLLFYQLLIRHGHRSPGDDSKSYDDPDPWYCDNESAISPRYNPAPVHHPRNYRDSFDTRLMPFSPSCRNKDLTTLGMQQEFDLGKFYRNYLVDRLKFLPEKIHPSFFFARASQLDRTHRSAISFIQGMYPPTSPNEVLPLVTDTDYKSILHPPDDCPEIANRTKDFQNSDKYLNKMNELKNKYNDLLSPYMNGTWNNKLFKKIASGIILSACAEHNVPPEFNDDFIQDIFDFLGFYYDGINGQDKYLGATCAPLLREIFRIADQSLSGEISTKFTLFSAHDTIISALLTTFGYKVPTMIPLRAYVGIEFWEVDRAVKVRFIYDGVPIPVNLVGNKEFFLYSDLKMRIAEKGYLKKCMVEVQ